MKLEFCQTARLEVCYRLVSFFAKVKIFKFWPKTMHHGLILEVPKKLRKACQLNILEKRNLMVLVSAA